MSLLRQYVRPTLRLSHRFSARFLVRFNSTEAKTAENAPVDPKITAIVDQIAELNLLETSSLINELKDKLNIPDISLPAAGAAPAAAPAAPQAEEEPQEAPEEKTIFSIKLEAFDAKSKPKIIKEVKSLLGLSLVESKKFVEASPKVLKENVAKEDAEKIKSVLEGVGAKIALE